MEIKYVFLNAFMSRSWMPFEYIEEEFAESYYFSICHPMGILKKMHEFIWMYCRCYYCHAPIAQSLARCACGRQQKPNPIFVEFPAEIYDSIFEPIWNEQRLKDKYKRKVFNRKSKLENAGKYTKEQISSLLEVQEKNCYYCATQLIGVDGKNEFHIDHYVSLTEGGHNEISNLVLSCPPCNLAKGIQDGNSFTRRIGKGLDPISRERARHIRAKVRMYKKLKINNPSK